MIVKTLLQGDVYRACALQYFGVAFNALGSRKGNGRFDRPGVAALYLSLQPETAFAEFQDGRLGSLRPCALMAGSVVAKNLLDLTGVLTGCDPDIQAWNCDWEKAAAAFAVDPNSPSADCASWRCGDIARQQKLAGIYYNSVKKPGGTNLAIFIDDATVGDFQFVPHDPLGEIRQARLKPV